MSPQAVSAVIFCLYGMRFSSNTQSGRSLPPRQCPTASIGHWRGGKLRPLCVFDEKRMPYKQKITADTAWGDIPTCKEAGADVSYLMLRGIFMTPGATPDQVRFYVNLFKKVRELPEWKEFMETGAFNQTSLSGNEYVDWLKKAEARHRTLMETAGFLSK